MNAITILAGLLIITSYAAVAAPPVGSVSENQQFARNAGSGFTSTNLDDYSGRILVLMMMTPWCPICQSHAQAVGNGLLDHFDNPARGSLRGKNDNGVPITSLLLSTEEAATWDNVNLSFADTNGFTQWGIDANTQRQNPRKLLGYFRGGFINSNNLYDWGNDRRRIVVLNLTNNSSSHSYREIIINQNFYTSDDDAAARAAINRIVVGDSAQPAPEIEVRQPARKQLVDGSAKRNFGTAKVRRKGRSLMFHIVNSGEGILTDLSLKKSGSHPNDFIVKWPGTRELARGKSMTFEVVFMPRANGVRNATLELRSNDSDEDPFEVKVSGNAIR
jgi:hypothetical protein